MKNSLKVLKAILIVIWFILWPLKLESQDSISYGRLIYEGTFERKDLVSVACVTVSPDGKHLYSASFNPGIVNIFDRDLITGQISFKGSISDLRNLSGAVSVRLNDDGKFAAVTSFRSKSITFYERDQISGKLNQLAILRNQEDGITGLTWAVDAVFSPDSRFIYVIDGSISRTLSGSVTVFGITDDKKLKWIETNVGTDKCLDGARGIAMHPNGKTIFVASSVANTLVVISRDKKTGKTEIKKIIKDEDGVVHGLEGVFGVSISPDNRFVYTTSGRFNGDNAVSVFKIRSGNNIELIQELKSGAQGLGVFSGGNDILVSPDGRNVYVSGQTSNTIVNLSRNAKTGKLTYIETIDKGTRGPAGLGMSPDGDFLYVAAEIAGAISILRRVTIKNNKR